MFSMEHLLKGSWEFPWWPFCGDFNQNTVPPSWRLNANSKKHQPINQPKRLICFCLRPSANPYHNFNIKAFKQNVMKSPRKMSRSFSLSFATLRMRMDSSHTCHSLTD